MFIPKVWFEGEDLMIELSPEDRERHINPCIIDLEVGNIQSINQLEHTLFVKGETGNVIVADTYSVKKMSVISPYSINVPSWMKLEFEEFIKGE